MKSQYRINDRHFIRHQPSLFSSYSLNWRASSIYNFTIVKVTLTNTNLQSLLLPQSPSKMVIRLLFFVLFWVTAFGVAPEVSEPRPFFVFGDSLVDNGNNNYLFTGARADSPPYGIDTPLHLPTGRFSNGRTIPDILSLVFHLIDLLFFSMPCFESSLLESDTFMLCF